MLCPVCKSENIQRCEVVYDHGAQTLTANSSTVGGGGGFGNGGGFGGGGAAHTVTNGFQISNAAKKCAPPAKKLYLGALLFIIGVPALLIDLSISGFLGTLMSFWGISWIGMNVLGYNLIKKDIVYNKQVWPGLYDEWKKKWYCNKCGNIF